MEIATCQLNVCGMVLKPDDEAPASDERETSKAWQTPPNLLSCHRLAKSMEQQEDDATFLQREAKIVMCQFQIRLVLSCCWDRPSRPLCEVKHRRARLVHGGGLRDYGITGLRWNSWCCSLLGCLGKLSKARRTKLSSCSSRVRSGNTNSHTTRYIQP